LENKGFRQSDFQTTVGSVGQQHTTLVCFWYALPPQPTAETKQKRPGIKPGRFAFPRCSADGLRHPSFVATRSLALTAVKPGPDPTVPGHTKVV
jgi:hypothetical protein